MPVVVQRSHLVAAGAIAVAGLLVAFRGPWPAQAAATGASGLPQQVVYVDQFGRPLAATPMMGTPMMGAPMMGARPIPATLETTAPVMVQPIAQPQAYARPASTVRASSAPRVVRSSESRRSWKKSALIIGGSAGTGAGIGGLVGGKKGAAIGAAIGGGGAALYEAIKR
jgi:hypothetical protein